MKVVVQREKNGVEIKLTPVFQPNAGLRQTGQVTQRARSSFHCRRLAGLKGNVLSAAHNSTLVLRG